ncbi:MAG: caspase family protein [Planctomycetia bacterium]|nr:caspase family protein [Planctomycetia bacterium]
MTLRRLILLTVFALALCCCANARAQKLYLFAEGDIKSANIKQGDMYDIQFVRKVMRDSIPSQRFCLYNDPESVSSEWRGPDVSNSDNISRDIFRAIESCPAGSNDIVFFYWTGHGAYDSSRGHYLALPPGNGDRYVFRSKILSALKQKNPRLIVFITDTCHSLIDVPSAPCAAPTMEMTRKIRSLFFDCRGVLDANSSSPGQKSISTEAGSIFTILFTSYLQSDVNRPTTWKAFFSEIDDWCRHNGKAQRVYTWSWPTSGSGGGSSPDSSSSNGSYAGWTEAKYHPENGDRIIRVRVDGQNYTINSDSYFRSVIGNASSNDVILTLVDNRSGKTYDLRTMLRPRGNATRLGIYTRDTSATGVLVYGVMSGSPGAYCRMRVNSNVAPVRAY